MDVDDNVDDDVDVDDGDDVDDDVEGVRGTDTYDAKSHPSAPSHYSSNALLYHQIYKRPK